MIKKKLSKDKRMEKWKARNEAKVERDGKSTKESTRKDWRKE